LIVRPQEAISAYCSENQGFIAASLMIVPRKLFFLRIVPFFVKFN